VGQNLLIHDVSRSHSTTQHSRRTPLDEWSARRRDLYLTTHNTHNRQTSMSPGGIRTNNLSRRAAADVGLRPRGHWDRPRFTLHYQILCVFTTSAHLPPSLTPVRLITLSSVYTASVQIILHPRITSSSRIQRFPSARWFHISLNYVPPSRERPIFREIQWKAGLTFVYILLVTLSNNRTIQTITIFRHEW